MDGTAKTSQSTKKSLHSIKTQPFACRTQNVNYYFDTIQQAKAVDDYESFDVVCKNPTKQTPGGGSHTH